jgi:hypothetical protein
MSIAHEDRDSSWPDREAYWHRKLRRIQFGAEPILEQVARHFRVTVALTGLALGIGFIFLAIFAAFERPDVGAVVLVVLVGPVVGLAWLDHAVLQARVSAYLKEMAAHKNSDAPPD